MHYNEHLITPVLGVHVSYSSMLLQIVTIFVKAEQKSKFGKKKKKKKAGVTIGTFETTFTRRKERLKILLNPTTYTTFEPPRGKTNNVVSEQVRHKPACASTEKS